MWGCGILRVCDNADSSPDLPKAEGGIYMANNVSKSCRIWSALVKDPGLVVGHHGDLEHVREILGPGEMMQANTMYWMTDRTPHESLPLEQETHRQFFRLVTSELSAWFPGH